MSLSIRKIFINLKLSLLTLAVTILLLGLQLLNITQYSQRLTALKNQHTLIEQIRSTDLHDIQMATIVVNGHIAELALSVKLFQTNPIFDFLIASKEEQQTLSDALRTSSTAFQDAATFWIEATTHGRSTMYDQMMSARSGYLADIDHMIDYQIQLINQTVDIAKITTAILFVLALAIFFLYQFRLNQIYRDINKACSIDTNGTKPEVSTQEIDFIVKRLARKAPIMNTNLSLLHPQSGLNNEKGMVTLFNAKRLTQASNSVFIALFEIDHHANLSKALSSEDMGNIYKKIGDIISLYEQTMDVIAQLDNNTLVFIMSRTSKDVALGEAEKIVQSVNESSFNTAKGPMKITLSAGFLLKTPASTLEASILDAAKIVAKAKDSGGNRVAQLRERADNFR